MLDEADVLALAGVTAAASRPANRRETQTQLEGCSTYLLTHAGYIMMTILVTSNRRAELWATS